MFAVRELLELIDEQLGPAASRLKPNRAARQMRPETPNTDFLRRLVIEQKHRNLDATLTTAPGKLRADQLLKRRSLAAERLCAEAPVEF